MTVAANSPSVTPASEPSQSWEACDDPCLPTGGETRDLWEYTSPEGWTHLVYIDYEDVDITRTPPYMVAWVTPDYTHHEYQTPSGERQTGPHVTPYQTELRAMTYEGALGLARSLRDEIISTTGSAHEALNAIVARAEDQNADRTTIKDYFNDWEAAVSDREKWRAERAEIHEQAREEYAEVCKYRRAILEDLEADADSFVPLPTITDEDAYDELVTSYVDGDLWLLEFESELERLLD